ncbi:hypothetical protein ZIOFF_062980 [Zingiber officinale]|uniref:Pectinesterase inhibitor domain-containing protein n=2 Tax=Zingiber officinale TaxID=94328 RepID=A0A8J5F5S8_ZINOF|nr:hypothetical protein ZIOFF_062980 [Zingiber officinale]
MIIAANSLSMILVVAICAVVAIVNNSKSTIANSTSSSSTSSSISSHKSSSTSSSFTSSSNSTKWFQISNAIQVLCSPTTHLTICESNLKDAVNAISTPKDLDRVAIDVIVDEVSKAFEHSDTVGTMAVKSAVEVCQKQVAELNSALNAIDAYHLNQLPEQVHELKNWLSAAATYQETCIDGFPDGEQKDKILAAMTTAKQLTCNALAIVGRLSSFLSLIKIGGGSSSRRLLAKDRLIEEDGAPNWLRDGDVKQFLLGGAVKQLTPNIIVAKDDSGDFKTISEVLAKIPNSYDGR